MAKAYHREANVGRWVGVRPAHNGVQVQAVGSIAGGTSVLYTVASGYVLLLTAFSANTFARATGAWYTRMSIFNSGAVNQFILHYFDAAALGANTMFGSFVPPMEMVAGDYIQLYSSNGAVSLVGSIHGFLVPTNEFD